jgi:hypothetical protein
MRKRRSVDLPDLRYYEGLQELKEASIKEANELLKQRWEYLGKSEIKRPVEFLGRAMEEEVTVYLLGRFKRGEGKEAGQSGPSAGGPSPAESLASPSSDGRQASASPSAPTPDWSKELDGLNWRDTNRDGKKLTFEFTFHTNQDGSEVEGTHALAQSIAAAPKGRLALGQYEYTMSKDGRFIQRRKTKA